MAKLNVKRGDNVVVLTGKENGKKGTVAECFPEEGKVTVKVEECPDKWYGMTYKEDTPELAAALLKLTEEGTYPKGLWK